MGLCIIIDSVIDVVNITLGLGLLNNACQHMNNAYGRKAQRVRYPVWSPTPATNDESDTNIYICI